MPFPFHIPATSGEKDRFVANIHKIIASKEYYPSIPPCYIDVNKENGVTRSIPVFTLKDYCVYYYCIKKIEDKIAINRTENTFGGWTLGGLLRRSENEEMEKRKQDFDTLEEFLSEAWGVSVTQYSFNHAAWSKSYGDLNAKLYATSKEDQYRYVVELDIANFYDSIRLDILELKIREIVDHGLTDIVSLLFLFLNFWNRNVNLYNKQTVGIPQDAMGECSRILANFYLQDYDRTVFDFCQKNKLRYMRYADDQFVFANNMDKIHYSIFYISKILNSIGLSLNAKKVCIMTSEQLIKYRCFSIFEILSVDSYEDDVTKVSNFTEKVLEVMENGDNKNLKNSGYPLLNKALCCPLLKKIEQKNKDRLVKCFLDDEYLSRCKSRQFQRIYDLLDDREKDNFIEKLNYLCSVLIHNCYHYEVLDFLKKQGLSYQQVNKRIKELKSL